VLHCRRQSGKGDYLAQRRRDAKKCEKESSRKGTKNSNNSKIQMN